MPVKLLSYFIDTKTPVYGGKTDVIKILPHRSIDVGHNTNELIINIPNHTGTHIDFPKHFSNQGKSISDYNGDFWVFDKIGYVKASVENFVSELAKLKQDIEILIWKSGFGNFRETEKYWQNQPIIPSEFADIIKSMFPKLRILGFDMISLTSIKDKVEGKKAHLNFLIKNDILIIEDMNLNELESAPYKIVISPWQIKDADGVPCTIYGFLNK